MTILFTQLGNDLEQIITGVKMRRRARRNWMERLMVGQDDSRECGESSEEPNLSQDVSAQSQKVTQPVVQLHVSDKHH